MERMAEVTEIVDWCLKQPFPGTDKWPAGHPIWDCNLPGHASPKEAWYDEKLLTKAVQNMLWVMDRTTDQHFIELHKEAIAAKDITLARRVLARFTIAKIAPKVTALKDTDMLKILDSFDISNGAYLPMAGFGGIKEACIEWAQKRCMSTFGIEAYDINQIFCDWYGWEQRDMLAQKVKTAKTCIVCPPFGKKYEHWKGTPDEMSDKSFEEWYRLIKEFVIAPQYIIIGPETKSKSGSGLFCKTTGIQLWTDEMVEKLK